MHYTKVIAIDGNEFGIFELEDGTYRAMVFNWDLKKQKVLFYEDTPGKSVEGIERVIQNGFLFNDWGFQAREGFDIAEAVNRQLS